jgi:cyclopropane fatty-acyl-phospholipid synthase-like methyltransferase
MDNIKPFESKLGEKSYWDNFYTEEIEQFNNNTDLIGEIWFGKNVQKKEINYILETYKENKNIKVLDIGCGNAAFLLKLHKKGFKNLYGMDYSEKSIELARQIIEERLETDDIKLFVDDLSEPSCQYNDLCEFDLIHDKGTFDAYMSDKNHKAFVYFDYIIKKSRNSGVFLITSCNFTKDELLNFVAEKHKERFSLKSEVPHKSFYYGGSTGQTVTTLIFNIFK